MTNTDANKWNERYRAGEKAAFSRPRDFLVEQAQHLPKQGVALDLAMGLGGNAGFLIKRGLRVFGVDISEVAVRSAKACWPEVQAAVIDLAHYRWPVCAFDVILNFYYLQRDLWPQLRRMLKPNGIVVAETLTIDTLQTRPDFTPEFLLQPGELRRAFAGWEVLIYREGLTDTGCEAPRAIASLVARLPRGYEPP